MSLKVRKAVIPAAGFGTRFLPATRSVPKVMLPVLDTPTIHFAVEEAARAGIEKIVLVLSEGQDAVVGGYFGHVPDLERALERRGDRALLDRMRAISDMADVSYVYQREALGLGHAVLMANDLVGDEPFAVFLPDDLIFHDSPTIGAMVDLYHEHGGSVIAVKEVPDEAVPHLGIVDPVPVTDRVSEIVRMVEKPALADAPSNLAIIGRYVLSPRVFEELRRVTPGALGELQLTDAIAAVLRSEKAYAYRFPGVHFDTGTPLGLLKASIHVALQRDATSADLSSWLKER